MRFSSGTPYSCPTTARREQTSLAAARGRFTARYDACFNCLQNGGGPRCNQAIDCAQNSGCLGGEQNGICDTGITAQDPEIDQCLSDNCCGGLFTCLDFGQDACFDCFNDPDHGEICDEFIACSCDACDLCF